MLEKQLLVLLVSPYPAFCNHSFLVAMCALTFGVIATGNKSFTPLSFGDAVYVYTC
jgi:hypothetical protein